MPLALGLIVLGVALLGGLYLYLRSVPDDLDEQLAATPGFDLVLDDAVQLHEVTARSLAGEGANRTRAWGVDGTPEALREAVDEQLTALGYELVEGSFRDDGASGILGVYRREGARFEVTWVGLPHRLPGGRNVASGYDFVAYTHIENGEKARRGS